MTQKLKKRVWNLYRDFPFEEVIKMQAIILGQFTRQIEDKKELKKVEVLEFFGDCFDEAYNFKEKKQK